MTLKVAIFGHSAGLAGAELSLLFCVNRMVAAGMEVHVVLPKQGPLSDKIRELHDDVKIDFLPLRWWMGKRQGPLIGFIRTIQSLWDTIGVLGFLNKLKPQSTLTISSVTPAPLIASKLLGIPSILTLGESLKSNPTLKSFLPKTLIVRVIDKCADRVLSCSRFVAYQYALPSEIAYPEIEEFLVAQPTTRNLTNPKMVMLGSYSSEKGQDLAIEVAHSLFERGFKFSLDFYGWGDEKFLYNLKRKVEQYGLGPAVSFEAPTQNVYDVFGQATLSLVLSRNEAFGKVTLESLSQGTPVIGLDTGGTSEILEQGGGVLVQEDAPKIAQRIIDLCSSSDDYREMQMAAISNPILYKIAGTRRDICSHIYEVSNNPKKEGRGHAQEH